MAHGTYTHTNKTIIELINLVEDNAINLNPSYQRDDAWNCEMRKEMIDTVINKHMPIPSVYLVVEDLRTHPERDYRYECLDGRNRLKTLWMFVKGEFQVILDTDGVAYFYEDLDQRIQDTFKSTMIPVALLENYTQTQREDYFQRLQNGKPLKPAQIIRLGGDKHPVIFSVNAVRAANKERIEKFTKIKDEGDIPLIYNLAEICLGGVTVGASSLDVFKKWAQGKTNELGVDYPTMERQLTRVIRYISDLVDQESLTKIVSSGHRLYIVSDLAYIFVTRGYNSPDPKKVAQFVLDFLKSVKKGGCPNPMPGVIEYRDAIYNCKTTSARMRQNACMTRRVILERVL
jgi:hypothetical protein